MASKSSKRNRGHGRSGDARKRYGWLAVGAMAAISLVAVALFYAHGVPATVRSPSSASTAIAPAPHVAELPVEQSAPENAPVKAAAVKMSPKQWQSLDELFAQQLRRCWTAPAHTDEDRPFVAKIKVDFSPDGTLLDKPTLINAPTDPAWKAQAALALKALKNCKQLNIPSSFEPFYAEWKTRIINFDPTL